MVVREPIRVAIVGGGCAGVTAAFELTRPEHDGRYEVTIYQEGWRLGGKGRSGRGVAGRIEEHGLHVWMGWYENAFRLMRECYDELGRDPESCPIASWRDAFSPVEQIAVTDRESDGAWSIWKRALPPMEGLPGDPGPDVGRWTMRDYVARTARLVRALIEGLQLENGETGTRRRAPQALDAAARDALQRLAEYGELATLAGMAQGASFLETALSAAFDGRSTEPLTRFLDTLARNARRLVDERLARVPSLRRVWHVLDLALATLRGQLRFGLLTDPRGFDAIDDYDCREWLLLNGASEASVNCGYFRALYDLGFAYEDGDAARPRISAGQAVRGFLRAFFTYRGAFFWKMHAGMGDVVFAPFYQVLAQRGVRFAFFHRLTNVGIGGSDGDAPHVRSLTFDVQARLRSGHTYAPLVDVGGLPCWPSEPDWSQLADGERMREDRVDFESHRDARKAATKTISVQRDFDYVVLAVGLGAAPYVCREILERDARWRAMVAHVKTVATQAFQIWLRCEPEALGWDGPPAVLSGFVEPFDTWADMRHVLPRESWRQRPRSLAYFCSALPDSSLGDLTSQAEREAVRARVRCSAIEFLGSQVRHIWPEAVNGDGVFRWDLLAVTDEHGDETPSGQARFDTQYWTANVEPSDRYTLALPGSSKYRISPLDRTYDNLTVAGDWTSCGFNQGCVEAAVMSGRLAAHALTGCPALQDIVGFDHP